LPRNTLVRDGAKPEDVQCLGDGREKQSVCLGDIRDCGVHNMCNDGVVIENPAEEQAEGTESVELKVHGKYALLKLAELMPR
jgi:hypothetical protein